MNEIKSEKFWHVLLIGAFAFYPAFELSRIIVEYIIIYDLEFYTKFGWNMLAYPGGGEYLLFVELAFIWLCYLGLIYYTYKGPKK